MRGERIHQVYLGLGSNLGDREANLLKAITMIGERIGNVVRQSTFMETEPWGFESEHSFLNGVILVETTLTPANSSVPPKKSSAPSAAKRNLSPLTPFPSKARLPVAFHPSPLENTTIAPSTSISYCTMIWNLTNPISRFPIPSCTSATLL